MNSNEELYGFIESLTVQLEEGDEFYWADKLRFAMGGSTGTEIFMALRVELRGLLVSGVAIDRQTREKLVEAFDNIDRALSN